MLLQVIHKYLIDECSIKQVYPRGMSIANPERPFVVIWEDDLTVGISDNGSTGIFVACHVPPDDFATLDAYIVHELFNKLDRQILEGDGYKFEVFVTGTMSPIIPPKANDTNTLSRDRLIEIPTRWR